MYSGEGKRNRQQLQDK